MPGYHELTGKLKPCLQAVGRRQTLDSQKARLNHTRDKPAVTSDIKIYSTIIPACIKSTVMTIPTQLSNKTFSLAVDTGAAVNILSEDAYKALKRSSRGGKWPLEPSDLNLPGVTGSNLQILGRFLSHCRWVARADYYENSREDNKYLAKKVSYCRRIISSMEEPVLLTDLPNSASLSERTRETIDKLHHTTPVVYSEDGI